MKSYQLTVYSNSTATQGNPLYKNLFRAFLLLSLSLCSANIKNQELGVSTPLSRKQKNQTSFKT